jgi:hypothetical protein
LTPLPSPDEAAGVEGLGSGVTDGLAEGEALAVCALFDGVADALAAGVLLAQLAPGAGVPSWAWPDVLARELGLTDAFAEAVPVGLGLPVGLALALPVVALPFGLALALALPVGLGLAPAWDGLAVLGDAVTLGLVGAIVVAADRVGPKVAGFAKPDARDWDGVRHGAAGAVVFPGDALPSTPLAPEARPVPPVPGTLAGLLEEPANTSVLTWTKAWRRGGTATSTTATANTATLMASAGRSIASRQSTGPRCAGRA